MEHEIVIVEDDQVLREELRCFFIGNGFTVYEASHHLGLLDVLQAHAVQLVLLDLNLPGLNGFEIAKHIKECAPHLGIIMLTARTGVSDRVKGYEAGADIYLPKPTHPAELLAAVRSLIQRVQGGLGTRTYRLHSKTRQLCTDHAHCDNLSSVEFNVLRSLTISPQQTLETGELLNLLETQFADRAASRRALENLLSRLRQKLQACFDEEIDPLKAVRGHGYQLTWSIELRD